MTSRRPARRVHHGSGVRRADSTSVWVRELAASPSGTSLATSTADDLAVDDARRRWASSRETRNPTGVGVRASEVKTCTSVRPRRPSSSRRPSAPPAPTHVTMDDNIDKSIPFQ